MPCACGVTTVYPCDLFDEHTHTRRRAVPLAVALLNPSAPSMPAVDTLSRLTHDTDSEVAQSAVLGLGIVGAGVWGGV